MNNPSSSLDDILKEIERDSISIPQLSSASPSTQPIVTPSIGMQDVTAHLAVDSGAPGAPVGPSAQPGQDLWENNLTERQRSLPKLSLKMLGGIAVMFVLTLGLGSVTFLSQQNQDLRQQAYVDTLPDLAGESAILTQDELEQPDFAGDQTASQNFVNQIQQTVSGESPVSELFLAGAILGGIVLLLVGVFAWLLS